VALLHDSSGALQHHRIGLGEATLQVLAFLLRERWNTLVAGDAGLPCQVIITMVRWNL
jgi:hypothetical protein